MGSSSNARQKAAEARAAAESAQKRRQRIINISIGAVLVLVVAAIVGGAVLTKKNSQAASDANPTAASPTGSIPSGQPDQYGIPVNDAPGKPVLAIWEDFQCPACKAFEDSFGETVAKIAADGDAQVIWRMTSFLDNNFPGQNSQRAASALGCAVDAGKGAQFHKIVYANQPEKEGTGYTQEQLIAFGEQAGISGDAKATFDKCVTDKKYMSWAANGTATMMADGIKGTPTLILNGKEIDKNSLTSTEALTKAVIEAGSGSSAQPSASPSK